MDLSTINRSELARRVGMTTGAVSRIFSGKRNPTIKSAKALAGTLDISLDDFVNSLPVGEESSSEESLSDEDLDELIE